MTIRLPDGLERLVVVVPTYNEAENLAWVVERLLRAVPVADVLVVDDGSPGRHRGEVAEQLAAADPAGRRCCTAAEKTGLGAAYLHGFAVALAARVRRGWRDGCRRLPPARGSCPSCSRRSTGADLVIGSRWVPWRLGW